MTIEEKLRAYILSKYRSLLEFTQSIGMPYGTLQSIFKRGLMNSSITNILKICKALGISADALKDGEIIPISNTLEPIEFELSQVAQYCSFQLQQVSLDGLPLTKEEADFLLDGVSIIVEQIRKKREKK